MSCIFCQIASGQRPARIYFEDKEILVFADIMPRANIHLLLIPKNHYMTLMDLPNEVLIKMMERVRLMAAEMGLEDNFRLLLNNGANSGQIIEHFHWHFLSNSNRATLNFKS